MGTGFNGPVKALAMHRGFLYVGGAFTNASLAITNIARWDGNNWSAVPLGADRIVNDLISDGTNLYAGGLFTRIGGVAAARIARWDSVNWLPLGTGLNGFGIGNSSLGAYKMVINSNRLYVVGAFNQAGGVGVSHVAGWDGTNWFSLGGTTSKGVTHFDRSMRSLQVAGTNLYAGGIFTEAGDKVVNSIAKWNGTNWAALNGGLAGTFSSGVATSARGLALIGNNLYVGGNFTNAGGVSANAIARWDGSNWYPLDQGLNGTVFALVARGTDLYVGGSFTARGDGGSAHGIARWDGNFWQSVSGGVVGGTGAVNALATDGTNVFVGGNFTDATTVPAANIAKWDGANWSALGLGVNNSVNAIALGSGGVVYAGGSFTSAGGVSANRIAKWDGLSWSALGSGVTGSSSSAAVSAIVVHGNDVYVAGNFTNAGGIYAPGIAKWNGTSWSTLGSGLLMTPGTAAGYAMTFMGNNLYLGGLFIFAGDKPSMFIARWNDQLNFYPPPSLQLTRLAWLNNSQFRFRVAGTSGESYIIQGTTNLSTWTPLLTNSATLYDFNDLNASSFPYRLYRAVLGP